MIRVIQHFKVWLAIIFLTLTVVAKADSWIDPTWKKMLDSSDVIALVEYTSNGDFRASARILNIYTGQLTIGDEIFVSGFSNRYGPIDKMKKGDRYVVFLNFNQPTEKGIEYWEKESVSKPELKTYVNAYKKNKAYYVWSPTSGDLKIQGKKVQYDLTQTSYYSKQNYYSLTAFENFLKAYNDMTKAVEVNKKLLLKIKPANNSDSNAQHLMQLFLLGYNQYNNIFEEYIKVKNPSSKYALAQLMSNIKTEKSRNILIALLDDKESIVQGETVRQLKNEPAEIVAPILVQHLKTSSEANFGPSNIMDPVMNTIDGGKIEIIKTLGELKHKPAVPHLLLLLDTENDQLFKLIIDALKNIGSREYIPYINKHLDNKTNNLIFRISMMIAEDSLVECLPSFKRFISTCNRNSHPNYEYTVSNCCGIGHFKDRSTISFLLLDYKRFLTSKDSLESSKQKYWTRNYIETFTELKVKEARPLIHESIHNWFGLNEDFGKYPKLFDTKKQLEDSIKSVFAKRFEAKGYTLNYCIAFIENTDQVANGIKPKVKFIIEVTIPTTDKGDEHQALIVQSLNLPTENVYIRFKDGVYHIEKQDRFDENISSTPIDSYISYAKAIPYQPDVNFLQGLLDNNFVRDDYYQKRIKEAIEEIKTKLN